MNLTQPKSQGQKFMHKDKIIIMGRIICLGNIFSSLSGTHYSWNTIEYVLYDLPFPKQALVFTCLSVQIFRKHCGKREIARNEQFPLFHQCFLPFLQNSLPFSSNLKLVYKLFQFRRVLNLSFGKGSRIYMTHIIVV